jgi:DNA-binding winged helix-turn-helix (wHTH) protein/Tfp pilus assembly protein PilF/TolB-like protein
MTQIVARDYEFGPFRLDSAQRLLFRAGQPLPLEPKVLDTLLALVENRGQLVEKEALIKRVWPDTFVEEGNLTRNIHQLRKVLGKNSNGGEYIETVPKRGYRFVAEAPREARPSEEPPQSEVGQATTAARQQWKRWIAIGLACVLIGAGYGLYSSRRNQQPSQAPISSEGRRSVAVLGFRNLSGRPEQSWRSNALSEMLTVELSAGGKLRMIPGENVARMEGDWSLPESATLSHETLSRIHRILGSNLVVLGSYLSVAGKIRVDLQIQDTSTGETVAVVSESETEANFLGLIARVGDSLRQKCGVGEITSAEVAAVRASQPASAEAARLYAEGLTKLRSFDDLAARDLLQKAIAADPKSVLAHSALSSAWTQLGYDEKAAQEAKTAFELSRDLSRSDRLAIEAEYREATRQWDKAVELYKSLWTFFPDDIEFGLRLADAQVSAGTGQAALATVESLRTLPAPLRDDPRIDLMEAKAADSLSDYRREQAAGLRADGKASGLQSKFLRAQAQLQQCWALRNLGDLGPAKAVGQQAQETLAASGDFRGQARSLTCIGNVLADEGNLTDAMAMHQKALALVQRIGAERDIAGALINTGNILASQQAIGESTKRYEEALSVASRVGDTPDALIAQNNIGANLMSQGDFTGAAKILQDALNTAIQMGDQGSVVNALTNLGAIAFFRGNLTESTKNLESSLQKSRALGLRSSIASSLSLMGDVQLAQDDLTSAEKSYAESLTIRTQLGEKGGIANSQVSLSALALEKNQLAQSESLAREAAKEFQAEKDADQETAARDRIAQSLIAQGKLSDAKSELTLATGLSSHDRTTRLSLDITSVRLLTKEGKTAESLRELDHVLKLTAGMKLVGYELLARLAQAEAQGLAGDTASARLNLQRLKANASSSGFHLVARKAAMADDALPRRKSD